VLSDPEFHESPYRRYRGSPSGGSSKSPTPRGRPHNVQGSSFSLLNREEAAVVAFPNPGPTRSRVPSSGQPGHGTPSRDRGGEPARLVVLASGAGSNLRALLDACVDSTYGAQVVAVGTDRAGIAALDIAEQAGVESFTLRVKDFPDRVSWDRALTARVASYRPDLVVSAGFMKLLGADYLAEFGDRTINTHPALLPAFPGMHGPRDALAYGVKITGCTVFFVTAGIDDGPIIAQAAVPVLDDDDEATLHERIKGVERRTLVDVVGRLVREGWTVMERKVTIP
jgi:phosphoribosylglycinamide formyltransferase-1